MELRQLRYFAAIVEEGGFSRAAERLHVSQPPLSTQIRNLENELGVQLLERSNRGVVLTTAGAVFYDEVQAVLARLEHARVKTVQTERGDIGMLSIGFVSIADYGILPPALKNFRTRFPMVEVQLHELTTDAQIRELAAVYKDKSNFLYLGRGYNFPAALEGALKLKEISYIHAEGYPAAEMKHGPIALIDENMPVVVIAPNDALLEKVKSNMQEVRARGGELFVFADLDSHFSESEGVHVIRTPRHAGILSPVVHAVPVQLLAYHTALARGTDVDKPRNLAKSVTVE